MKSVLSFFLFGASCTVALAGPMGEVPFEAWLKSQEQVSIERMLLNISPSDAVPGIVIASPSRQSPNYYFHWTRDSSLVMGTVINLLANAQDSEQDTYRKHVQDFVQLARRQQLEPSAQGLGEPRFGVDGRADTTEWARPQYDGSALRALALLRFMKVSPEARIDGVALAVIRSDLDFIAQMWRQPCYDLWEELRGLHFYTQAVQYSALRAGAIFFESEGDSAFALRLGQQAAAIQDELEKYWDEQRGYIGASRSREERPDDPHYKDVNLDTAVILAALHVDQTRPRILSLTGDRLLGTAAALESAFAAEYRINRGQTAVAIGRFTDDRYFGGNPWYLTTAAFAELHYRVAQAIVAEGGITLTKDNLAFFRTSLDGRELAPGLRISVLEPSGKVLVTKLRLKGDAFLEVIRRYAGDRGQLSEQFDRDAGVPVSAVNLTWSYASILSAIHQRAW